MFGPIFSAVFAVCALFAALFGFLSGKRKKWQFTLMKIITTVLAAVVSVFLSSLISWVGSGFALSLVVDYLPAELSDLSAVLASNAVSESARAIVSMTLAPALFYPLFVILKPILAIFNKPIARILVKVCGNENPKSEDGEKLTRKEKKLRKKNALKNSRITLSSSLVGALSGVVMLYIIAIPTVCGITMAAEVALPIVQNMEGEYADIAYDVTEGATDNAASFAMKIFGGQLAYNQMTTYNVDGHKATLKDESHFMAAASNAFMLSAQQGENYDGAAVRKAFKETGDTFKETTIAPSILPEVLSQAKAKWDNDETFCGMAKPSMGEDFAPVVDSLLDILSEEDYDSIKSDVATIFNVVGIISHDIQSIQEDPLALLGNKETVSELFEALYESERLYKVVPAFAECGIELMSSTLGIHEDLEAHYDQMNDKLAEEINRVLSEHAALGEQGTTDDLIAKLSTDVKYVFDDFGVDVKKESADALAQIFASSFQNTEANAEQVMSILADTEIEVIGEDEETITKTKISSAKAFTACTQLRVAEDIKINYDKPADTKDEAAKLADGFATVSALASRLQNEELTIKTIIVDLGHLLDCFHTTHTLGTQSTRNLLMCMLQSEEALDALKIHLLQITHLTQHICESADNDSYSVLLGNLVHTIDIIEAATKNENIEEEVKELITNLTPSTATTIQQVATPDTLQNYGVPEQSAEQTADLVTNIFGNLSDAKENNSLTEEKLESEAKAVADMMNIAMNATKGDSTASLFGEQSSTGITASDYVERVLGSEVISQTLVDTVYDEEGNVNVDPLNASINLTENEKTELVDAMNTHLAASDEEKKEETTKQLIAAAALLNINVNINESGVIELPTDLPDNLPF